MKTAAVTKTIPLFTRLSLDEQLISALSRGKIKSVVKGKGRVFSSNAPQR